MDRNFSGLDAGKDKERVKETVNIFIDMASIRLSLGVRFDFVDYFNGMLFFSQLEFCEVRPRRARIENTTNIGCNKRDRIEKTTNTGCNNRDRIETIPTETQPSMNVVD